MIYEIWNLFSNFNSYTSVNIFSRFLSDEEMEAITSCKDDPNGDYLAWNNTKWLLTGEQPFAKNLSSDIVCQPRNGTTLFSQLNRLGIKQKKPAES